MTPVEELRAAAAKLRETAGNATPGPWMSMDDGDRLVAPIVENDGTVSPFGMDNVVCEPMGGENAAWMALVHPGLAEPLAELMEESARQADMNEHRAPRHRRDLTQALAVAHVILRGGS
ncbi:hypothetical protein [Streptosporangium sp. G12]